MHKAGLFLLVLLISSGCSTERTELRVAVHPWPGYEFLSLAESLGYLDHSNVSLVESTDATASKSLLALGHVDAAALTLDEALSLQQQGTAVTIVLVFDISAGADMVLTLQDMHEPAELQGQRLGYEPGAVAELMLPKLLQYARLQADQIEEVHLPVAAHYDALMSGEVNAIITYAPTTQHLLRKGAHSLFDSSHIPNLIIDVRAHRTSDIQSKTGIRGIGGCPLQRTRSLPQQPTGCRFSHNRALHVTGRGSTDALPWLDAARYC